LLLVMPGRALISTILIYIRYIEWIHLPYIYACTVILSKNGWRSYFNSPISAILCSLWMNQPSLIQWSSSFTQFQAELLTWHWIVNSCDKILSVSVTQVYECWKIIKHEMQFAQHGDLKYSRQLEILLTRNAQTL
jgi:hypothetical protein